MKDLCPIIRTPRDRTKERSIQRPSSVGRRVINPVPSYDQDTAAFTALKSDLLALQNRIDILDVEKPATFVTHAMQQQEKLLFSLNVSGSEEGAKARLLEQVLGKVGELSNVLRSVGARCGQLPPPATLSSPDATLLEATPQSARPTPSSSSRLSAPSTLTTRPASAPTLGRLGSSDSGASPLQPLALPPRAPRTSFVEPLLSFVDAWAASCVADYDAADLGPQLSLEAERQRQVSVVHAEFQGRLAALQAEHAAELQHLATANQEALTKLQSQLEEAKAAAMPKKPGASSDKPAKDVMKELNTLTEENKALKAELQLLQELVKEPSEAEALAFGGGLDLKWVTALGISVDPPATPHPNPMATSQHERLRQLRKPSDENEIRLRRLTHKAGAYGEALKHQNAVLQQVQGRVQELLSTAAAEQDQLREQLRLLQLSLDAAIADRDSQVLKAQRALQNQQAETLCLRAEVQKFQQQHQHQLREVADDLLKQQTLPLVLNDDFDVPMPLPQKLKNQAHVLGKLDRQATEAAAQLAASQQEVAALKATQRELRAKNAALQAQVADCQHECSRLRWAAERSTQQLEEERSTVQQAQVQLKRVAGASGPILERTKQLEAQLVKANKRIQELEADVQLQHRRREEAEQQRAESVRAAAEEAEAVRRTFQAEMGRKDRQIAFAEERVEVLQAQLGQSKASLERRVAEAQSVFEAAAEMFPLQSALMDPNSQLVALLDVGMQLTTVATTLNEVKAQTDPRWLPGIAQLEKERDWLARLVKERR